MSSVPNLPTAARATPPVADTPCAVRSEVLLRGRQNVRIEHRGEYYQLSVTRQGKLILTK